MIKRPNHVTSKKDGRSEWIRFQFNQCVAWAFPRMDGSHQKMGLVVVCPCLRLWKPVCLAGVVRRFLSLSVSQSHFREAEGPFESHGLCVDGSWVRAISGALLGPLHLKWVFIGDSKSRCFDFLGNRYSVYDLGFQYHAFNFLGNYQNQAGTTETPKRSCLSFDHDFEHPLPDNVRYHCMVLSKS